MGDVFSLDTPESVALGYDVAGVGSRFLAAIIDTVLQALVIFAAWIASAVGGASLGDRALYAALAIGTLIIAVVLLGYFIFFELIWNGQSPGKRAIGLRVILTSGYPVTPLAVVIRNVLRLVDWLPSLYAVGVVTMIANRRSRRLGDLVAGTLVIKEGREGSLASLPAHVTLASPRPLHGPEMTSENVLAAAGAQPERLTQADEAIIRDFLSRRFELAPQRRDALARQIAAVVHNRIGGASPFYGPQQPEPYLEEVLAARDSRG